MIQFLPIVAAEVIRRVVPRVVDRVLPPAKPKETEMEGVKSLVASRTVWGAVVAIMATILNMAGFDFGAEAQAALIDLAMQIVAVAGAAVALWGRVVATKRIG